MATFPSLTESLFSTTSADNQVKDEDFVVGCLSTGNSGDERKYSIGSLKSHVCNSPTFRDLAQVKDDNEIGFEVKESNGVEFRRITSSSDTLVMKFGHVANLGASISFTGSLSIGYSTPQAPAFTVDVNGDVRATGNFIAQSDDRYKDDICTIDQGLDLVKQMRGVSYVKHNSNQKHMGLLAQEIETILPELVTSHKGTDFEDERSVNYLGVIPVLIQAIKEQQAQIDSLSERVSQ